VLELRATRCTTRLTEQSSSLGNRVELRGEKVEQRATDGRRPRRDANTAWTISLRGAQSGSSRTSVPRAARR
jgi:hypothetical protein